MTNFKFLSGALLFGALGMTSCSGDEPGPVGNGQAEDEVIRYIRVAIANPSGSVTRAQDDGTIFDKGTEAENAVSTMYLRFFDINGEPVAISSQTDITFSDTEDGDTQSAGKIKELVAQFSLTKGQNYPTYVLCSINPVSFGEITEAGSHTLEELRNLIRMDYVTADGNFAMSNATYYGDNPITGATNVKMMGAPILASQIYKTKEQAASDNASVVNIYVERYAAKVQFTLNDNTPGSGNNGIMPYVPEEDKSYALTFHPEAWTVNADEPTTYTLKRFDPTNSTDYIPSYEEVTDLLGGWTTWNDPDLHRSYWACSPTYYSEIFPRVSDDIIDEARKLTEGTANITNVPGSQLGAGVPVGDYKLRYYSYNQITRPELKSKGVGVTKWSGEVSEGSKLTLPAKYVLENTMGLRAFNSMNPKASAPSVLLVGNYTMTYGGETVSAPDGFCLYGGKIYYNNLTNTTGAPENARTILDAFLTHNQILSNAGGAYLKPENLQSGQADMFEIVHPAADVRGDQAIPQRYVTLQIKSTATINQLKTLYYKPAGYTHVVQVNPANEQARREIITQLNLLLLQQLGTGHMFNQNKGYFSIPIQHLGISENKTSPSPIEADGSINWKNARRGDFGIVRNHVYTISVDGIQGLATGIENFDAPLVPPMETDGYWVNYQIKILNWRIVPVQGGIILK